MYDFPALVKTSRRFYKEHDLLAWAKAIPRVPVPAGDVEELLVHADQHAFTLGFAFPAFDVQKRMFDRLVDACARQPSPLLPDNQQYRPPFLADNWSRVANGQILQRDHDLGGRSEGPYVILFGRAPLSNCWGKTGKQIAEQFAARGWRGLTVFEYLVLQRVFAESFRDHRFFAEPEDPSGHWLWLIDSMNDTDCAVALGNARGVNIQATGINNRESKRAGIAAILIPLAPG
ncbi:MAG: hypothetical protein WCL32_13480 [Planctomycetota bacterium]